jgi:prepilin-type processing-associated H-X9-DG protein
MKARKHRQERLANDWALGEGCVAVNDRVWFEEREGVRVVCVGNTPFYTYDVKDRVQHLFCAGQLIESQLAKQCAVIAAFGISARTLQRARRKMRREGVGGLVPQKKGPQRRHKSGGAVGRRIVDLWKKGRGRLEIAARLGLSEGTVRNVLKEHGLYPRAQTAQPSLPFAESNDQEQSEEGKHDAPAPGMASCDLPPEDEAEGSNGAVEATSIAYASPVNQLATVLGLVEEAPVEFTPARNVPVAGALLGLALLSTTGLMAEARQIYGRLRNCWYGLRATVWTLFIMALLRIKRPEQIKGIDPAGLGQVLGLPRAPEVKTIRRKLKELAQRGKAAILHRRLAKRRAQQHQDTLAYLYVDGHVRAYSGKRQIGKAYVTSRKSVMRAETDYWVNLSNGQPLLVVHAPANERLTQMMKAVIAEVKMVVGDRRPMIVFDRGGWCKELFRMLLAEGFDLLTYRKEPLSQWGDERFHERACQIDGHTVKYELADGTFQNKGWPRLRCLAIQRKDGRQTQILCSRYDLDPVELAYRMFGRWKQENWFKYMGDQFALDVLVDYATQPDDPARLVVNPAWRMRDREVKAARRQLGKAEAAYGRARLSKMSSRREARHVAEVEKARARYEHLCKQRRDTPRKTRLGEVSDGDPVKLTYERKLLTDTIKMCAYEVETQLTEMLEGIFCRNDFEGRAVVREIFQTHGDLTLSDGQVHIHLDQLSAPRYTEAMMSLCEQINTRDLALPETTFGLRFHVKPRPERRQK